MMCLRQVTFGLAVPRKARQLPGVLSPDEIIARLQAAPSPRNKRLLGFMYVTGMRVSELVRVRWRDVDFDRRLVNAWHGMGRTDRQVMLPVCSESLLFLLVSPQTLGDTDHCQSEKILIVGCNIEPSWTTNLM
jgi:site-specific recombinase XerD